MRTKITSGIIGVVATTAIVIGSAPSASADEAVPTGPVTNVVDEVLDVIQAPCIDCW